MNLLEPIDIYCERLGAEFWAEPLNAATNLSFFIAAWCAWRLWKKQKRNIGPSRSIPFLILTVALIGEGSLLFHTFANRWSMYADIFFITVFMYVYLGVLLRKIFRLRTRGILTAVVAFFAIGAAFIQVVPSDVFNGSEGYFASIIAFGALIMGSYNHRLPHTSSLVLGMIVFTISIFFRSVDMGWCQDWPMGTHFLWHLLNGIVLYLLMRYLILNHPPKG
jgi:hypothetical protein